MDKLKKWGTTALIVGATVGASAMAQDAGGAGIDGLAGDAVDTIKTVGTVVLTVGGAIIGVAAIAMAVRWVKATFF